MAGPGARRCRLGLSSCVRSRLSGVFRALRFAGFARQTDLASGVYRLRGEEVEGDRREPSVTEEGKLLAALSSSLIYAALSGAFAGGAGRTTSRFTRSSYFICSHTCTGTARSSTRRACCPLARSSSDDAKGVKDTVLCLCWCFRQPATQRGGERASEMWRVGSSHSPAPDSGACGTERAACFF